MKKGTTDAAWLLFEVRASAVLAVVTSSGGGGKSGGVDGWGADGTVGGTEAVDASGGEGSGWTGEGGGGGEGCEEYRFVCWALCFLLASSSLHL